VIRCISSRTSSGKGITPPNLSDVILLRPTTITGDGWTNSVVADQADEPDPSTTYALRTAEFALFSAGPDQQLNPFIRADPGGFNADNIVVTGR